VTNNNPNPYKGATGITLKDLWDPDCRFPTLVLANAMVFLPAIYWLWKQPVEHHDLALFLSAIFFTFLAIGTPASALVLCYEMKDKRLYKKNRKIEWESTPMKPLSK
jgi:hypothetical protein